MTDKTFEHQATAEHVGAIKRARELRESKFFNSLPPKRLVAIEECHLGSEPPKKFIRRFPSNAVRSDDTGRERPDYISPYAEKAVGEHFAANKNDFGATNYWLGIPEKECLASIKRHFLDLQIAIHEGDTELARKEWQALTANCIMGLHTHEIIRLGKYVEVNEGTELVEVK